jgi:hypothetical protein
MGVNFFGVNFGVTLRRLLLMEEDGLLFVVRV